MSNLASWLPIAGDLWLLDDRSLRDSPVRLLVISVKLSTIQAALENGAAITFKTTGAFSHYVRTNQGQLLARNVVMKNVQD